VVVDTSWLPFSKKVLLSVDTIREVDWATRTVTASVDATTVEEAPTFDPSEPINEHLEPWCPPTSQQHEFGRRS